MKRKLSFILALLMLLPMVLGALPQLSFADAVEITDNSGYGGGIRKKSDGSILFSPYMSAFYDAVGHSSSNAPVAGYTIDMTFTLLSGDGGEEVHTFPVASADLYQGNGSYYDIYLNGSKGNSGFCPAAGSYYNIYVEIYSGRSESDKGTLAYYGTYTNKLADTAIGGSSFYAPTSTAKEMSETGVGSGLRKKSDGRIMFSPAMVDLRNEVAAGKSYDDFTVKATFSLLDDSDAVSYVFPTVSLQPLKSNGSYVDMVLKSDTVDLFCPEAGKSYKIDVQICTAAGVVLYEGTYEKVTAASAIADSPYYQPTPVAPGFEEHGLYKNGVRKTSAGNITFSPYLDAVVRDAIKNGNGAYTAKLTFTVLDENGAEEYTFNPVTVTPVQANSYVDMALQTSSINCGFCPEAGKYYNIKVELYNGSLLAYKDVFENILVNADVATSPYYAPSKKGIQITETKDDFTGSVTYNGVRKNSSGNIMFCPFMTELRNEVVVNGKSYSDFTIKAQFHLLDDEKKVVASFPATLQPQASKGYYVDIPLKNSGFCPTAGKYYDIEVEVYEGDAIKYYGTYKNILAAEAIAESSEYQPTAIPGQPADYEISLSYSFNNDLAGSAAGNVYFTVDKAGYFEIRWADAEGKPLTAAIGEKTLPYAPLFKLSVTEKEGATYTEKIIGFTAIPQGAAKLIVTDSAMNVLKSLDIPANKQLAAEEYRLSFGTISDLHYNYFWLDDARTQDAAIPAVDNALAFYEALGVDLITAVGDYSLYNEENSYQKYQTAVSKVKVPVLACAGNHEVYTWNGDSMYAPGSYWLTYMNNGFYDGTVEGVLDVADNGVDLSYSIPGFEDYVFISLNQWYYDGHTAAQESLLKDEQLEWLAEQFETYKDKTVYLLFHTYLGDDDFETIDGQGDMTSPGGYTYGSFYNQYTDDEAVLRGLLEKYENVVWFNGHSHYEYSIQKYNENLNIFDYYGTSATMVHVPSVTNMRTVDDTSTSYGSLYRTGASQGALTFAYDGYQIINGVDLQNEEILSFATFIVYDDKTETGTIEGTDITWTYDEQLGSLRFDGTGALPDYEKAEDAPYAKYAQTVRTVYVADGITAVGANAFNGYANLSEVALKDDVKTIGKNAFEGTAITKLTLPEGMELIDENAFAGITTEMTVIYYGSSAKWPTITIKEESDALTTATLNCRKHIVTFDVDGGKTDTEWKDRTIPSYNGKPIKEHTDPNKFYVFVGWSDGSKTYLAGEELPKATKSVTYTAVFEESTEARVVEGSVGTIAWKLDRLTGILTVSGTGSTPDWTGTAKGEWHAYASEIYEVVVEEGITVIGTFAFSSLPNLDKITLPNGVTTLSADAFSYNANLKTLVLPSTIKTVGQGVTYQTNNIKTIYFGCGAQAWELFVSSITAFYNDSLKNASPVFAHEGALECTSTDETHTYICTECSFAITANHSFDEGVPGAPGTLEKKCACGYTKIEKIIVSGTIGTITWSLDQTTGVLTVSGTGATPNWTNDTKSEWHAYADLITKIVVEEGVTVIGSYAFSGLKNVTEVVLSAGITAINTDAFSYDSAMKILHLPASLTTIGQGVLYGANGVSTVYYAGCAHQWAALIAGITAPYNDNVKNASPVFAKTASYETTDETHTLVCAGCNKAEAPEEHSFGEIVDIKATVYHAGGKYHTCTVCKKVVEIEHYEQITAIGGDIDMDGDVNISDVTALLNYLSMNEDAQNEQIEKQLIHAEALNVDGEDDVNIADVTRLLSVLSGAEGAQAVLKPLPESAA